MNSRQQEIYQELKAEGMSDKKAMFISDRMFARENGTLQEAKPIIVENPQQVKISPRQKKAVETMQNHINGQILAHARIWGSVEAIPERQLRAIGGILKISEHPEMRSIAPTTGEYEFAGFKITRRKVDQLDQCTFCKA
jgi:hypothetical protein